VVEAPKFQDGPHMNVVRVSALRFGLLYRKGNIPGTHFFLEVESVPAPLWGRKVRVNVKYNETIGKRTRTFRLDSSDSTNCATACLTCVQWGTKYFDM